MTARSWHARLRTGRGDERRWVTSVLVDACQGSEDVAIPDSSQVDVLLSAARFHRIAPLVLVALRHTGGDGLEPLQQDRFRAIATHLQACAALDDLAQLLQGVDWLTFKGPVFSETAHPVPGLRSYNDVDVLVAPSSLRAVCHRLHGAGWRVADFEDMFVGDEPPGEMHWITPGGVMVDLHWSMINMHTRRRLFTVPTSALLERRVPVPTAVGQAWWTLDPIDSLLHACLHAALAGANKLIYLVDVDRLSRAVTDWDELIARAQQWGVQSQLALVVGRAKRVLGTPIPADLESRLGVPLPLRALMSLTDAVTPVPGVRRSNGWSRFVARAVGPTTGVTLRAGVRHALRGLKERVQPAPPTDRQRIPADTKALETFLRSVETRATLVV